MYASELEIRIRYEELRREADRRRLVREATKARAAPPTWRATTPKGG
ncbi:hypothetical protein O1L55_02580 [Streptomyces albulus]|nr:hypothetical protein [Streptomyces noursei]